LVTVPYPFGERSTLETEEVYIGEDVFLDAVIALKEAAELPLHISSIDGTQSALSDAVMGISDANGALRATCEIVQGRDLHPVYSLESIEVGLVVTFPAGLTRLLGRVAGQLFNLLPSTAEFSPDVTFVATSDHLRYVRVESDVVDAEDVKIVAGHGVKFTYEDEVLRLHVLGDAEGVLDNGLRSINGVSSPSIWLATHPRSNLRLSSENRELTFTAARDAT
jgi:hypothetical protein